MLAVILGAASFPKTDLHAQKSFQASATAFKRYLIDKSGLNLPSANVLDLFDDEDSHPDIDEKIAQFLKSPIDNADDLIVYYVGHGDFSASGDFYLALFSTRTDNAYHTGYPITSLANTLKEHAPSKRRYIILDCCFSAAAHSAFQSAPLQAALQKTQEQFPALDSPNKGTALLCAAGPRNVALALPDEEFTMFSGAMIDVLTNGISDKAQTLSLRQLKDLTWEKISSQYPEIGVRPLQPSPDESDGDIGLIPFFPTPPINKPINISNKSANYFLNALDIDCFENGAESIYCTTVIPETQCGEFPLEQHVRRAWEHYEVEILRSAAEYRDLFNRASDKNSIVKAEQHKLSTLSLSEAFTSSETLVTAVVAMCRADIVVFDLTGFEPGAMLLLGIRSVARRGVTICSLGGEYQIGSDISIPFNLQALNLAAHSDSQEESGMDPLEIIGRKMCQGFRELTDLPHYLDLPAYDSVRHLGLESNAYRPVGYDKQVLCLCPFSEEYSKKNWKRYLSKELLGKLMQHLRKEHGDTKAAPQLFRLLDLSTPRLISQTLYESIRLTEFCIVDWTNLRPNVLYEAGVRMATNPLGGIHIVEEEENAPVLAENFPPHTKDLIALFKPRHYQCLPGSLDAYEAMVNDFEARLNPENRENDYLVYQTVGLSFDETAHSIALPVVEELLRSANLLASDDDESTGISPVLYHDVNKALSRDANEAATERRLAAWLYIDQRYTLEHIRKEPSLYTQYRTLGAQIRRALSHIKDEQTKQLLDRIRTRMQKIRTLESVYVDSESA